MNMTVLQDFKELPAAEAAPGKKKVQTKRKRINYFTCTLPAKSLNEGLARGIISSFCAQLDPTVEELCDMKTAISEAVTNCIVHAYPEGLGIITLRCRILKDNTLDIVIKDKGVGIPDVEQARRPAYTTGGSERSGMGFTIMESFMTDLEISSAPGKGTSVHMRRKLQRKQ